MTFVVAVTGHRPDKLGGFGVHAVQRVQALADSLIAQYAGLDVVVITGMALGWDQAIARACMKYRVPFHAYLPFEGQHEAWPVESQRLYFGILEHAAKTVIVSTLNTKAAFLARNVSMIDQAQAVIALWDGSPGGTGHAVGYAGRVGVPVHNYWETFSSLRWRRL